MECESRDTNAVERANAPKVSTLDDIVTPHDVYLLRLPVTSRSTKCQYAVRLPPRQ